MATNGVCRTNGVLVLICSLGVLGCPGKQKVAFDAGSSSKDGGDSGTEEEFPPWDSGYQPPYDGGPGPGPDGGEPDSGVVPRALGATPPMGWNSWNKFGCNVSEALIEQMADALVASGLKDAGYEYVVIDDCWQTSRTDAGVIVADPVRFPSGIDQVAAYVHSLGLKFGLYTDLGTKTCQGRPGSLGYELIDANTYASWGVDFVKADWCNSTGLDPRVQYKKMRDALTNTGRPILFSICNWGVDDPWEWAPAIGHMWRTTGDIQDSWQSMISIVDANGAHAAVAGPGRWNDPDMLEVGNGGMTTEEYRVHMSLWAIMAAPLIAGNDLANMSPLTIDLLTNPEVIAVDQDPAGIQGVKVKEDGTGREVWGRPLSMPGERAVVLLNKGTTTATVSFSWTDLGLQNGSAVVRDLWTRTDLGSFTSGYTGNIPAHAAMMLKVTGTELGTPPAGTNDLSDLPWVFAVNGYGPVERNKSNGEAQPNDGKTITLNGTTYTKGLGVHAESSIRYYLGGKCSLLTSAVGVDDETGNLGSVVFQVFADGNKLYDSGTMIGSTATKTLSVSLTGNVHLELRVTGAGDNLDMDHADWASPQLTCTF